MSTYTSEPGTRLAGRYRLVEQVTAGAGWTYWKATDETLARSVTVLTFAVGFPRVAEAGAAARAASRLNDPRFPQVFDVEDAEEPPYVVMEWVVGESLLDMLSEGPLDLPRAAALVSEAAQAIPAAHAAGPAHLRLDPACLHWTPGGGVKIAGLGIDAALAGETAEDEGEDAVDGEDPALTDTRDLARLLYAALTGYWPGQRGSEPGLLPPAPETDGALCTPRQVSADVPGNIDAVICQALFQRPSRHGPALSTPAMLADALASVAPPGGCAPPRRRQLPPLSPGPFPGPRAGTAQRSARPRCSQMPWPAWPRPSRFRSRRRQPAGRRAARAPPRTGARNRTRPPLTQLRSPKSVTAAAGRRPASGSPRPGLSSASWSCSCWPQSASPPGQSATTRTTRRLRRPRARTRRPRRRRPSRSSR